MFIPPPLKIPNLCSSDICGRINNVILRTVNPCSSVSIRVPKTFVLFVRFVFKKAVHPSPTHQCRTQTDHLYLICHARRLPFPPSRHDHYHYSFTSLHNLPAINNIHTMRQAADTGTCSDASAVKGINILVS